MQQNKQTALDTWTKLPSIEIIIVSDANVLLQIHLPKIPKSQSLQEEQTGLFLLENFFAISLHFAQDAMLQILPENSLRSKIFTSL